MKVYDKDFSEEKINEIRKAIESGNEGFITNEAEENNEELVNFFFLGKYEGHDVVYDALMYTLRLHHNSEIYELAEHKAAQKFPNFRKIEYEEDENGDLEALDNDEEEMGLFMAQTIIELEDEEVVKVQEHAEIDPNLDFRIGLDIGLNVESINTATIKKFIGDFNDDNLSLDETLYSFQTEGEELQG
ncbi:MAG: hypothetical protein AAF363_12590 [Bacteroidota bacterium]